MPFCLHGLLWPWKLSKVARATSLPTRDAGSQARVELERRQQPLRCLVLLGTLVEAFPVAKMSLAPFVDAAGVEVTAAKAQQRERELALELRLPCKHLTAGLHVCRHGVLMQRYHRT
jgi:hypothetical protein